LTFSTDWARLYNVHTEKAKPLPAGPHTPDAPDCVPIVHDGGQTVYNDGQVTDNDGQTVYNDGQITDNDGQTVYNDGQIAHNDGQIAHNDGQIVDNDGVSIVPDR
jgi:hypothetical protein